MKSDRMSVPVLSGLAVLIFALALRGADKPRVFVTNNTSWYAKGSAGEEQISGSGNSVTSEVIKIFREKCSSAVVNMRVDKADYVVLATDDGSGALRRGRRIVVSTPQGDVILSKADRGFGGAVKDACNAIAADWSAKTPK